MPTVDILFTTWGGIARAAVMVALVYPSLILLLRLSGKRTLSQMNAFDLVVTVALGSTLATIILSKDVAYAEGVVALAALVGAQYLVAWLSIRSGTVESLVKADPSLLLYQGRYCHDVMRAQRVTEAEVLAAVRAAGLRRIEDVGAVVLETNGRMTALAPASLAERQTALGTLVPEGGGATPPADRDRKA